MMWPIKGKARKGEPDSRSQHKPRKDTPSSPNTVGKKPVLARGLLTSSLNGYMDWPNTKQARSGSDGL